MELTGISAEQLTEIANVSIEKARRWKREGRIPARFATLIQFRALADLGAVHPHWQGYRLINGLLWTPEDDALTPAQIRAAAWWRAVAKLYAHQLKDPQQYPLL